MPDYIALDLAARVGAATVLLLLAGSFLLARRRDVVPWLGVAFTLSVLAFVVTSSRGAHALLGPALWPLTAVCVLKTGLFWLLSRGLFDDDFGFRLRDGALLAGLAAFGMWHEALYPYLLRAGTAGAIERAASALYHAIAIGFVLAALWEAARELRADLHERRRRLRVQVVSIAGAYLLVVGAVQLANLLSGASTPPSLVLANLAFIAALAAGALFSLLAPRADSWLLPARAATDVGLSAAELQLLTRVRSAMEVEHAYRREGLSIAQLARALGTHERNLRRVINRGMGFRNFNEFLHSYRIREACERLRANGGSTTSVLAIALEVGYQSLGPFNRAFKERVGMTPTEFRRSAQPLRQVRSDAVGHGRH